MPSAGASEMFARFGKMRTDTSKKYGCIVVSDASKALEKSPLRRPLYVRPSNKDERRGLGVGRSKGWHKVAESRIKASMKPLKSENRIIKHNLEKSKQLISEENDQEEDENKSLELHSPSPDPEICQVDGIPVQFGQQHSTSSTLGSAFQRQVELRTNSSLDGFTKDSERPLHSPEYVGQDIVYHVFYQDNPLDIIESLLVARKSYDSSAKLEENEKQRSSEALVETLGKLSQRGDSTGADNLSTQESATLEQENSVGIEGTTSDRLLEGISEEIQVNLLDSKHAQVEETPRRHRFRASWDTVPAILKKQDKRIRAEEGGLSKDLEAEDNQGGQLSDGETTISWNITSPEAENMEQSLLQLLNARLQVLSSHKLKYLLGVMDKLEGGDVDMLTPQEHPCEGVEVSAVSKTRTLSLRILSTWGDKHFVGLVQVDLFDTDGKKIDVQPMQITSNCEAAKELGRIVDGGVNSSVWEALLPLPGSPPLEIFFQLPSEDTSIGHLEVWNHTQSIGKGVRDLQVLIDGEIAWQGTVSKSSGSQVYDSCTRIPLREGVTLPNPSIGKSISITPPSPKLEFEVSRLNSSSPKFEDSEVAGNKLATRQAVEKVETESIWSRAARYLQRSIASKREPQPEETDDADDNLQADIDKLEEDNMELEEIERILNSDGEDTCTFYNKFEQNVSQKVVSANLSADATYEMFSVDMLDESADKAALLQALSYTDDADLEELDGDEQQISELVAPSDFSIPLLPLGMKLTIDIHSSWGDPHYVGLSGIEIFDDAGQVVHIDSRKQISVGYTTAALLSGLNCSPCPVERLVDNVNLTCDDSHMWLAPFSPGHPCTITISLEGPTLLGMVRFWNYNKSTMHTYRGARLIRMFLDSQLIFYGELRRASGLLSDAYNNAEPILFTNNEASLCAIEMHDAQTYKKKGSPGSDGLHDMNEDTEAYIGSPLQNPVFKLPVPSSQGKRVGQSLHDHCGSDKAPMGRVLRLNLLRSWGDCYYFGLTGIQARTFYQNSHYFRITFVCWTRMEMHTQFRVSLSLESQGT
ncbi:uncharacterized protein LOC112350307 [Selaginella moellendorffii]|uniref:uncharacterized protein LOC112350307 n=1 Tax=Selaginella moellendorffii TaxID=88036 RepID=UPI000D1CDACF|nr:uncharacterized protein LOC112350307 [Selaginella moellendorffii]|eukprot:XP_024542033.1 uncharacterized protein LOC112350307 [Selaginella moellendorffii]